MSHSTSCSALDAARMQADPLADAAIASILGPWQGHPDWRAIGAVNREMEQWQSNGTLGQWRGSAALEAYLQAGMALPAWADRAQIERAETLFMEYGALSCTLLFCSSLPECYVIPDLAAVLHIAGQLEAHTEYRIRATAGMIFPVMMKGGLAGADGTGVAQVLKVRLIHATIRHLVLRGDPQAAAPGAVLPPLAAGATPAGMHGALFAHGWDLGRAGMPCSQEELAYTLLTFGYVFLRSLRKLGLGLASADETAYLHAWNVMGHVLGIERALMADTMDQAEALFARFQARGRAAPCQPDPRPALGQALMQTMEAVIPLRMLRPFPVLMTRYLCGAPAAAELGIDARVGLVPHLLFGALMGLTRAFDALVRLALPGFSIARMLTRVVGYQFTCKVLMDQTRPLRLPPVLLGRVAAMTAGWHTDPKAPAWVNAIERWLTGRSGAAAQGANA